MAVKQWLLLLLYHMKTFNNDDYGSSKAYEAKRKITWYVFLQLK